MLHGCPVIVMITNWAYTMFIPFWWMLLPCVNCSRIPKELKFLMYYLYMRPGNFVISLTMRLSWIMFQVFGVVIHLIQSATPRIGWWHIFIKGEVTLKLILSSAHVCCSIDRWVIFENFDLLLMIPSVNIVTQGTGTV